MVRDKLHAKLRKLPDIERLLSKIYTYSAKTSVKAIYIDIAALRRLDEFYNLLSMLSNLQEVLNDVFGAEVVKSLKSRRLKALVRF